MRKTASKTNIHFPTQALDVLLPSRAWPDEIDWVGLFLPLSQEVAPVLIPHFEIR
jgi:hypothetical protein